MCVSRKLLPMTGVKSFVLGFSLSLFSVSLCGQLFHSTPIKKETPLSSSIKVDLFKNNDIAPYSSADTSIFADIAKQSLTIVADNSIETNILSPEGIEDDEILNLSADDSIPIEYNVSSKDSNENTAEVLDNIDAEEKTAMLPTDLRSEDNPLDSPWIVAKGAPNIKNKRLAQDLGKISSKTLFTDDFQKTVSNDKAVSYKVAEKIKQSIIFPIPDEILNDENLTPTFIKGKTSEKSPSTPPSQPKQSTKQAPSSVEEDVILDVVDTKKTNTNSEKGFLGSISSWFSDKPSVEDKTPPTRKKATPSYGSQDNTTSASLSKSSEDLASFYESLQNTQKEYSQRKIIPSELRLFFQPGRAEISGSTLRWLKTFSDAAQDDDTFLQINLDASASTELQKKRLDLLYTILMNNGVDFRKVDTNFSLNEPNAFVIRTIKNR